MIKYSSADGVLPANTCTKEHVDARPHPKGRRGRKIVYACYSCNNTKSDIPEDIFRSFAAEHGFKTPALKRACAKYMSERDRSRLLKEANQVPCGPGQPAQLVAE